MLTYHNGRGRGIRQAWLPDIDLHLGTGYKICVLKVYQIDYIKTSDSNSTAIGDCS